MTWTLILKLERSHRYFRHDDGRIAVADDSGRTPDTTDDGILWVDTTRPISIDGAAVGIPLVRPNGDECSTTELRANAMRVALALKMRVRISNGSPFGEELALVRRVSEAGLWEGADAFRGYAPTAEPGTDSPRMKTNDITQEQAKTILHNVAKRAHGFDRLDGLIRDMRRARNMGDVVIAEQVGRTIDDLIGHSFEGMFVGAENIETIIRRSQGRA